MNCVSARIDDSSIGFPRGYVYLIFSQFPKAFYIGQTRGGLGALGRLSQHLSQTDSNTFLKRVAQRHGLENTTPSDIIFLAIDLPRERRFEGSSSEYREAIEGAVHLIFLKQLCSTGLSVPLVSNYRINGYSRHLDIELLAEDIVRFFFQGISKHLGDLRAWNQKYC